MNDPTNDNKTDLKRLGLALAGHISRQNLQRLKRREELTRLSSGPLQGIATKRSAKAGKKAARQLRKQRSQSMLDMPALKGHQLIPRFTGEREKVMFAAYARRITYRQDLRHGLSD